VTPFYTWNELCETAALSHAWPPGGTLARVLTRAYKYLPTNTHSRVRDALNMRGALNVSTGDQRCV